MIGQLQCNFGFGGTNGLELLEEGWALFPGEHVAAEDEIMFRAEVSADDLASNWETIAINACKRVLTLFQYRPPQAELS